MVHGVRHEVAHDPLDPARVDLGVHTDGQVQPQRRAGIIREAPHGLDRAGDHAVHVDPVRRQVRDARVQPADLQQVREQRLEPVELRHQQLRAASQGGQQLVLGGVQDVRRHPHGGQRRAQLVADVRGEPPLQRPELLELADLGLDAAGHLVVRLGQPRHLVVAVHGHAFVEVPVGEPLGDLGGLPDRPDDLPGDQARDPGQEQEQHEPAHDQRALHQRERALLGVQREQQVELQVSARRAHRLADDQRRDLDASRGDRDVAAGERASGDVPAQVRRDVRDRARRHLAHPGPVDAAGLARTRGEDGAELPRRGRARVVRQRGVGQPVQRLVQLALRALAVRVDARQLALEHGGARLGLAEGVDLLALQDPAGDLRLQHQAQHEDDGRRERERADDDPHLQRPPPDRVDQRADLDGDGADLRNRPPGAVHERQPFQPCPQPVDGAGHGSAPSITSRAITEGRPCTPRRERSGPPRGARDRARPWTAAAGRAR